ncbi:MAG: cell division protein ZipA C-terminal FtsZ-binding domain-containing protein [Gammaproteobacteria bacterium]|nr:cell division protein ZipA C-terminal FtsZ-binding domain-containing protein [Gammaproteobacteria bacterium]
MDRELFRLIIIVIGLIVMALIYYFDPGRRRGQPPDQDETSADYLSDSSQTEECTEQEALNSTDYVHNAHVDNDHYPDLEFNHQDFSIEGQVDDELIAHTYAAQDPSHFEVSSFSRQEQSEDHSDHARDELIAALNDETVDLDDEELENYKNKEYLAPFNDSEGQTIIDSQSEIEAALKEPKPDPDRDPESFNSAKHEQLPSVIVLHLLAPSDSSYQGSALTDVFAKAGLRYGSMDIYHYYDYQKKQEMFSVANLREPGTIPEQMTYFESDGLSLFMQPDTLENPLLVFDKMVECADVLYQDLGGKMLDDKHQPVTQEYLSKLRNWLIDY